MNHDESNANDGKNVTLKNYHVWPVWPFKIIISWVSIVPYLARLNLPTVRRSIHCCGCFLRCGPVQLPKSSMSLSPVAMNTSMPPSSVGCLWSCCFDSSFCHSNSFQVAFFKFLGSGYCQATVMLSNLQKSCGIRMCLKCSFGSAAKAALWMRVVLHAPHDDKRRHCVFPVQNNFPNRDKLCLVWFQISWDAALAVNINESTIKRWHTEWLGAVCSWPY